MLTITVGEHGDLTVAQLARVVQCTADAYNAADADLCHIETTLDTALLAAEQELSLNGN